MPDAAWIYAVLPFLTMAVLTIGLVVVFRQRSAARRDLAATNPGRAAPPMPPPPGGDRPWWGNPLVWIGVCVVSLALGALVWPGLFGVTFILLPFVWIRRPRRPPPSDPRSNGHAHRDGGAFSPP
jgi:hypothetical protein